jgi:lambda family phage tail tape measure protein
MSNDVVFGMRLTYEGREANVGLEQTRANVERLGAVSSKMASQYSGLNTVVKEHSAEVKDTEASVRKLLDRYDPLGAKLRQLQADFKALDAAASSGRTAGRDDARVDAVYARLQREITAASSATAAFDGTSKSAALSAGQLRMATQQLPLQFQDIWVSLAAGQNPMMVLAQQGTQIAGSFGGVGNAAKAMGRYIVGLINPLSLAAAAAVAGGAAWYYWGREAETAADKAVAAAEKVISSMRATDAVYLLQRERDKIKVPVQWLSYDEKQLAKLDGESQKLVAEYKKIDKQLKGETERSTREWEGLHASAAERKATELKQVNQAYAEQVALARGNSDKLIALERQHQQKIAAINTEFEEKPKKTRTPVDPTIALAARIEADAFKSQMEAMGVAAEQIKVYELARRGATKAQIEAAQAAAELKMAADAETKATKASKDAWDESAKAIDKANTTSKEYVNQLQFENSLLGLSTLEVQKRTEARRIDLALEKELLALRSNDKLKADPAALKAAEDGARQAAEAAKAGAEVEIDARHRVTTSWEFGSKEAIRKYDEQVRNSAAQAESLYTKAFKSAEDAVTQFVMTSKVDVRSLGTAIIEEFTRINISRPLVNAGAGMLGDIFGAIAGGLLGGSLGSASAGAASTAASQYSLSSGGSSFGLKLGGGRASGGPVDPNTLHPVNERGPELLSYGGNDYLMMGGRGGYVKPLTSSVTGTAVSGGDTYHVSIAVDASGNSRAQGDSGQALDFGKRLEGVMRSFVINEKRAGGLLAG